MPILKIPIVHKFGIISHSQRIELQERLLRQTYNKEQEATFKEANQTKQNQLQILEKFVNEYTSCNVEKKEILREKASATLAQCKRRAGLSCEGEGAHVNLPLAWSELTILAQCKGKIQEDCFAALNMSLNHAPLSEDNIPTLFFLAESALYWIQTDSVSQPYLRTAEIHLLKMGQLVFLRLLYHYYVGNFGGFKDFQDRLKTYLEGIEDHQRLYTAYPNMLLSLRFMSAAGNLIVQSTSEEQQTSPDNLPFIATVIIRALLLWRATTIARSSFKKSLIGMLMIAKDIAKEDWISAFLAISIVGEAARNNLTVCKCFQDIARGVVIEPSSRSANKQKTPINHFPEPDYLPPTATTKASASQSQPTGEQFQEVMDEMISDFDAILSKDKQKRNDSTPTQIKLLKRNTTPNRFQSTPPITPAFSVPVTPSTVLKKLPITPPLYGIRTWSWESALQYCQILVDMCLNGTSASIQKAALMGKWEDADVTTFRAGIPNFCLESCGIVDLLEFQQMPFQIEQQENRSWHIRYGAVSGLVTITHSLKGDKLRHGMRSAAFSLLHSLKESRTQDRRVLEAIRVGQIEYGNELPKMENQNNNIWKRICVGLSEKLLSPLVKEQPSPSPTPRSLTQITRPQATPQTAYSRLGIPQCKSPPKNTTLKEDLLIHTSLNLTVPNFHKRNEINLNRVLEDQWRKELIERHTEEERARAIELKEKRKAEDAQFDEVMENRRKKLNQNIVLSPYEV